jgi:hypothetical protein
MAAVEKLTNFTESLLHNEGIKIRAVLTASPQAALADLSTA